MITPYMLESHITKKRSCKGCVLSDKRINTGLMCFQMPDCTGKIFKLKREYKPHYRTPPANYRDSENDLS